MARSFLAVATVYLTLGMVSGAFAGENWETRLTVRSGSAENRLAFGQHEEATDRKDGIFDVPALLAGNLRASFYHEEGRLWRDIRRAGAASSRWTLEIDRFEGSVDPVVITWNPKDFPEGTSLELIDTEDENKLDMTTVDRYEITSPGDKRLVILCRGEEN